MTGNIASRSATGSGHGSPGPQRSRQAGTSRLRGPRLVKAAKGVIPNVYASRGGIWAL